MVFIVLSCQQNDDLKLDQAAQTQNKSITKTVSAKDVPQVISFIESKSNGKLQFTLDDSNNPDVGFRGHEDDLVLTTALTDQILQETNSSGKSNYTFPMIKGGNKTEVYFLNLVVKEYMDTFYMYIAKYVPDPFWTANHSINSDFGSFTGTAYFYSDQGSYLAKAVMSNGTSSSVTRHPCDSEENDYDDNPAEEDVGWETAGGIEICITVSVWYQCQGTNAAIPHSADDCRADTGPRTGSGWNNTIECSGEDNQKSALSDILRHACTTSGGGGTPSSYCSNTCDFPLQLDENCDCVMPDTIENNDVAVYEEKEKPCPRDPLPNIELAHQLGSSGWKGGMFGNSSSPGGCTRYGSNDCSSPRNKKHDGLDLVSKYGDPVFAMYDGVASSYSQTKNGNVVGAGHYVSISSIVDGEEVTILYFHLQDNNRATGTISAGQIIGFQGESGNLKNAIQNGKAVSHLHIKVKDENGNPLDPRFYLGTEMDVNGNVTQNNNCN